MNDLESGDSGRRGLSRRNIPKLKMKSSLCLDHLDSSLGPDGFHLHCPGPGAMLSGLESTFQNVVPTLPMVIV